MSDFDCEFPEEKRVFSQEHTKSYRIENSKRVEMSAHVCKGCDDCPPFTKRIFVSLPENATEEYFREHKFSREDMKQVLKDKATHTLCVMALCRDLDIQPSAFQSKVDSSEVTYGTKTAMCQKILKHASKCNKLPAESVLHEELKYPMHKVPSHELKKYLPITLVHHTPTYWNGKQVVACAQHRNALEMVAVIPRALHLAKFGKSDKLIMRPLEYLIDGVVFVETDNRFLLVPENHSCA